VSKVGAVLAVRLLHNGDHIQKSVASGTAYLLELGIRLELEEDEL
jgi:hypothetical protein